MKFPVCLKRVSRGQVLSEYAIMLAMFTMICLVFILMLSALMQHGWRVLSLVANEPFD